MSLISVSPGRINEYLSYTQDLGLVKLRRGDTIFFSLGTLSQPLRDADGNAWNLQALFNIGRAELRAERGAQPVTTFDTFDNSLTLETGRLIFYKSNIETKQYPSGLYYLDVELVNIYGQAQTMFELRIRLEGDYTIAPANGEAGFDPRRAIIAYPVFAFHPLSMKDFGYTGDLTAPRITFSPANNSQSVSVNSRIDIVFSEPIRNVNNNAVSFAYMQDRAIDFRNVETGETVEYTLGNAGLRYILTPNEPLKNNTRYTVSVSALEDSNNNLLPVTTLTFRTSVDISNEFVWIVSPDNQEDNVELNADIQFGGKGLRFTGGGAITAQNIAAVAQITKVSNANIVPYSLTGVYTDTASGIVGAVLNPTNDLDASTEYRVRITNVQDLQGNAIPPYEYTFRTRVAMLLPGGISGLSATPGANSVFLDWSNAASATSYEIEYDTSSSFTNPTVRTSSTSSINIGSLSNGTYYARVTAVNQSGRGAVSNPVSFQVQPVQSLETLRFGAFDAQNDEVPTTLAQVMALTDSGQATGTINTPVTIVDGQRIVIAVDDTKILDDFRTQGAGLNEMDGTGFAAIQNVLIPGYRVYYTAVLGVNGPAGTQNTLNYVSKTN